MKHSLSSPFFDPVILFFWLLFTLLLFLRHIFANKSNYETPEIKRKNDEKPSMYPLSEKRQKNVTRSSPTIPSFDFS